MSTLRKGWCPGAMRPMAAKDGLLVRLRITGGILPAQTAAALASLAARHGNGLFDLSVRGNLQMRGVRDATLPRLRDRLDALDLLDENADREAVRNVIASPLSGLHADLDVRPLTIALENRVTSDTALHRLPAKFGFLIDDGSTPSLAGIDADVRFDRLVESDRFSIGLAGTRMDATRIGTCAANELVESAVAIAHGALTLFARCPDARRMRDLIAQSDAVAEASGGRLDAALPAAAATRARDIVGLQSFSEPSLRALGLAAPFGRLDAAMLRSAADLATTTSYGELRLTPWRVILVPGTQSASPAPAGFITDPLDPRLAVAACVGSDGCERGTRPTHRDAEALAAHVPRRAADDIVLHVSGCAKGCVKASATAITLVARDGRYDLVRHGRAGDIPVRRGVDLATAKEILESAVTPLQEPA